jgi:formamidopyrimidine-DNA glycosylase
MLGATHEIPTPPPLSMPELPEVETVRRGLLPVLEGKRIAKLDQNRKDLRFPLPADFAERVRGRKIERLERRAKYLLAHLSGGDVLLMHLGMSGRFTVHAPASEPERVGKHVHETGADRKHDHVVFHMEQGATVTYNDPRRFGFMLLIPEADLQEHPLMHGLGVEPLSADLSPEYLARRAAGKKVDLKAFLSDQRIVAGLGNIYVCEALFRAGLSPLRKAATIAARSGAPTKRAEKLVAAIRAVLKDAIAAGGSSLRDYRRADGALGEFQHTFAVYGREGKPCGGEGCRGTVKRIVQSRRSTFYCPKCQR